MKQSCLVQANIKIRPLPTFKHTITQYEHLETEGTGISELIQTSFPLIILVSHMYTATHPFVSNHLPKRA